MSEGIALETGIPRLWDNAVPVNHKTGEYTVFFLHTLVRVRGISFGFEVLYKHSQQHKLAKGAKVWVEVRDRSESRSGSVVDLRVVDLLVVNCQARRG